jgi:L-threonylcarbamoyladenylate synthase
MELQSKVLFLDRGNGERVARSVADTLEKGGVCVIPTDTIYGIVAIDRYEDAVRRIYEIKGRPENKPLIRLIGRIGSFSFYSQQKLPAALERYWPGPLTVLVRGTDGNTVSIRYPYSPWLDLLFRAIDYGVIVAPSANRSGAGDIYDNEALIETFRGKADTIVCMKEGIEKKRPSTIIDITTRPWRVVREGAIRFAAQDLR